MEIVLWLLAAWAKYVAFPLTSLFLVAVLLNGDIRDHTIAFITPFIIDSAWSCKTSEEVKTHVPFLGFFVRKS
jgi:hypothetical protein